RLCRQGTRMGAIRANGPVRNREESCMRSDRRGIFGSILSILAVGGCSSADGPPNADSARGPTVPAETLVADTGVTSAAAADGVTSPDGPMSADGVTSASDGVTVHLEKLF